MNLPPIPTDNLYKFCAVAGLILLLFGVTFPVQKLFETQNDLDRVTTKSNVLRQQVAYLHEDTKRLDASVKTLLKDTTAAAAHPRAADLLALQARTSTANTELGALRENGRELAITSIKLNGQDEHLLHLIERMWLYSVGAVIFMFGGLALARFGFARWYYRVQKPADELLAHRASGNSS